MSDKVNTASVQETEAAEAEKLDKLAYTKKRYLTPKEIAAFVLVNFGQKNLSQFIGSEKQFFLIQYAGLSAQHYANIELFATIYDALDDTISGLIIDRTRTRWGRVRPFFILPLPLWILGGMMLFSTPNMPQETPPFLSERALFVTSFTFTALPPIPPAVPREKVQLPRRHTRF